MTPAVRLLWLDSDGSQRLLGNAREKAVPLVLL